MTEIIERKHPRTELNQPILVVDIINGVNLGELVNVSVDGIMILSKQAVPIQSIYQLTLQLPIEIAGRNRIDLGADCLWCRQAEDPHRYWAGLQIIDISDEAIAQLEALIACHAK
ncbi:MAG: PilZ domain-containing protein [Spongiibacteraceae bacterium]